MIDTKHPASDHIRSAADALDQAFRQQMEAQPGLDEILRRRQTTEPEPTQTKKDQ